MFKGFSFSPQCQGNTRGLSHISKNGSHIKFTTKMLRRCVVRYVLGLRYVIRRSVERATGVYTGIQLSYFFSLKHRLWVLARTASIYVLSKSKKFKKKKK